MQGVLSYRARSTKPPLDESHLLAVPWLRSTIEAIEAEYKPEMIWLFGSRAEGRNSEESDYDLLVVIDTEDTDILDDTQRSSRFSMQARQPIHLTLWPLSAFERQKHSLISPAGAAFNRGVLLYDRQAL